MTVRALGAIAIAHGGDRTRLTRSQRGIVAILVAAGPDGVSDAVFAENLWGGAPPKEWEQSVRQAISRMRRALPVGTIRSGGRRYALDLPIAEVDVWQLLADDEVDLAALEPTHLVSLLSDPAYPDVDAPLVDASRDKIADARRVLVDRLIQASHNTGDGGVVSPAVLTGAMHLAQESYDEDLLEAVVRLHVAAGASGDARRILMSGIERIEREIGVPAGDALRELATQLESTQATPISDDESDAGIVVPRPRVWGLPAVPEPAGVAHQVRREPLLAEGRTALSVGGLVIHGDSGTGKSMLARQLLDELHRDQHVIWAVAQRSSTVPYGPILALFPALADALDDIAASQSGSLEARRWLAVVEHLQAMCPVLPIVLVIDDAQWLDSETSAFAEFVARGQATHRLTLVVIGRPDGDDPRWRVFSDYLERANLGQLEVRSFSRHELVELVGRQHPGTTSQQRLNLADKLVTERATLPAIAASTVASLDPQTLRPTARSAGPDQSETHAIWTDAVAPDASHLACIAALLGITWSFGELVRLAGVSSESVADAIDELLDADLIVPEPQPDRFSFRHVLIQEAFVARLDRREARRLHIAAAEHAKQEHRPHEHARHLRAAGPQVAPDVLCGVLAASGHEHLRTRSWFEAARAFAAADEIDPTTLGPIDLAAWTDAAERSGRPAAQLRERAFRAAVAADDPALMVDVAVCGVETGEVLEGQAARLPLLKQVARERLSARDQFRLDVALCREAGFDGAHDQAAEFFARMQPQSVDDRAEAWMGYWSSVVGLPVQDWPALGFEPSDVIDPVLWGRVVNTEATRALRLGDRAGFDAAVTALAEDPVSIADPLRRWHLYLLETLHAFIDGRWAAAAELADQGASLGHQHGIAGAFSTRAAQLFAHFWTAGTHADLLPLLSQAAPDVVETRLADAAHVAALAAAGSRDAAYALAGEVLHGIEAHTSVVHPGVCVLLAGCRAALDERMRHRVRALLEPHSGSAVIIASGIAHLGPADRGLAFLADDPTDAAELLRRATTQADRWSLPIWSIRCRLDLADLTDDAGLREEARILADTGELEAAFFG